MEFLKSARIVSVLTLTSRVFGLVRDMITTMVLSVQYSDALFLAWTIPNLFRKLFGEGALSSAFIPIFVQVEGRSSGEQLRAFVSNVISALFVILFSLMAFLFVLSFALPDRWILPLFQGDAAKMGETLVLVRILIPYLVVSCIIAQFQGILNSRREFAVPAMAPVLLNIFWIVAVGAAALLVSPESGKRVYVISWGIILAGGVQLLLFVPSLRRHNLLPRPRLDVKDKDFRRVMAMTAPMVLALSANQLNVLVDRFVVRAYVAGDGGVTHLYLGLRMMQFPFALIGIALVTAVFPLLARLSSEGNREGMKENLAFAIRINLFLSIPAMVGLLVLAEPIISLFFERGNFVAANTEATCNALVGYTLGLPFLSTVVLLTRAFYSMERWRAPLYTGAALVVLNVALDFVLVGPLAEAGVALATSITVGVQVVILFFVLRHGIGPLGGRVLLDGALRALLLSLVLGAAVFGVDRYLDSVDMGGGLLWRFARVALPILAGMIVYFVPARILCSVEFKSVVDALRRREGRDRPSRRAGSDDR